jgi:hypothetical protein
MYAVIRVNSYNPEKLMAAAESVKRFEALHRAQPGYVGAIVVDLGGGRRLAVNVWESQEQSMAGLSVLGPEVAQLLNPHMSDASEFIGAGPVISDDFAAPKSSGAA